MFGITGDPQKGGPTSQRMSDRSTIFYGLWGLFTAYYNV